MLVIVNITLLYNLFFIYNFYCNIFCTNTGTSAQTSKTIYDCNFDTDFCGWGHDSDYYLFKWERRQTGDPNRGYGPLKDVSGSGAL